MTIRSITAVGPNGNFVLATDTEVWKYFAPGVDAMSRPWPERWEKIELPKELTAAQEAPVCELVKEAIRRTEQTTGLGPAIFGNHAPVDKFAHYKTIPVSQIALEIAKLAPENFDLSERLKDFANNYKFETLRQREDILSFLFNEVNSIARHNDITKDFWPEVAKIMNSVSGY